MRKDFNKWNEVKKDINKDNNIIKFRQRDIIFVKMGINIGFEQDGKGDEFLRPVLVYKKFNSRIFLGIPLTSKVKTDIFHFCFESNDKISCAILSQIKLFDIKRAKYKSKTIKYNDFIKLENVLKDFLSVTPLQKKGERVNAICNDIISKKDKNVNNRIFLTGGAGYIGSHTCIQLLENGYDVVVYDNLSNSSLEALKRVEKITSKKIDFIKGDIRDEDSLVNAMQGCNAVIHFAGLKAVGESVQKPIEYYDNNVNGTLCLLRAMKKTDIKTIVFSSSATVYGDPQYLPLDEKHPLSTTNPYGASKLMIEDILRDLYKSDTSYKIAILRYFNPVGSHTSGLIGEDPNGIPNNLMPFISQVAVKKLYSLGVFGDDYDTIDGTGVRDYIHVVDLANAHLKALQSLKKSSCEAINIGTGNGYSVLEVVSAFEKASKKDIPYNIKPRREGDIASCYANANKAKELLKWQAKYNIDDMCIDTWNWQSKNPNGYNNT